MISKTIGYNGVHNIFRHTHLKIGGSLDDTYEYNGSKFGPQKATVMFTWR